MPKITENKNADEYPFSLAEIESLAKTRQDYIDGKTTARNWTEIEEDLDNTYRINRI
jgi:hypothetical protein